MFAVNHHHPLVKDPISHPVRKSRMVLILWALINASTSSWLMLSNVADLKTNPSLTYLSKKVDEYPTVGLFKCSIAQLLFLFGIVSRGNTQISEIQHAKATFFCVSIGMAH